MNFLRRRSTVIDLTDKADDDKKFVRKKEALGRAWLVTDESDPNQMTADALVRKARVIESFLEE